MKMHCVLCDRKRGKYPPSFLFFFCGLQKAKTLKFKLLYIFDEFTTVVVTKTGIRISEVVTHGLENASKSY